MSIAPVVFIPARYGSTRFPGKPLAPVAGRSGLERVVRIAQEVVGRDAVFVATDDARIAKHAEAIGASVVMTSESCRNGTERVCEAMGKLGQPIDIVVNLQGDAVLTPPWFLDGLVREMQADPAVQFATPAVQVDWEELKRTEEAKKHTPFSGTFVTFNQKRDALYFSKMIIPALRDRSAEKPPVFHHIGLYGYRRATLEKYVTLPEGTFEKTEGLEQLRALEHGIPIRVVLVDYRGRTTWSIDSPSDVTIVEDIIRREGELL